MYITRFSSFDTIHCTNKLKYKKKKTVSNFVRQLGYCGKWAVSCNYFKFKINNEPKHF